MKRKLLPYGMPLGGAGGSVGSAMGAMGSAAPSSGGGKSSGLGQGGYGAAPGFQQTAQTQPSFAQSPYGAGPSSVNTTTTADMMGGNRGGGQGFGQIMQGLQGGKSSGLGQGGYGMAPGFGGQPQPGMMAPRSAQYRTKEQEAALDQRDYQNYSVLGSQPSQVGSQQGMGGQINLDDFMTGGGRFNPYQQTSQVGSQQGMGGMGGFGIDYLTPNGDRFSSVPPPQQGRGALGGMGGFGGQQRFQQPQFNQFQQQQPQDGFDYRQYQQEQQMNQMRNQFQQQQQFNPFQQQFGGFQQPQQQFNPFQQQFGGFQQQQPVSGLRSLFNNMMGQQQMQRQPMQRQPMQQYQDPALQYRPNMQNAQAALSRVRPSVQRQNQDAQAARIAELEAQLAGYNTPSGE
jgi:hypothetical protein